MPKVNLPTNPPDIPPEESSSATSSDSFRGFLLAAYKSIADTAHSLKITRLMLVSYLLILVVAPPILIMVAFLTFPSQTAGFFNFEIRKLTASQNPNSQVLGESTSNTRGNVFSGYLSAVLEPQAAATVQTLRVISPETVSGIVLPSEQSIPQITQLTTTDIPTQATGGVETLTLGSGLTGELSGGDITLNLSSTPTFTTINGLTLPTGTDTLAGLTTAGVFTNKTIDAGSNTIFGLTNSNLSGTAGITNANLANSSITVTAGTGLSGGGAVGLGGSVSLTNAGVISLTGTSNQVNVSSSTGDITLTLPQNIHTAASPTFSGLTLSTLTNCGALSTSSSGVVVCNGATGDTATFSDTNPATIADNDTTELFNDATKPSITPDIATQTILVSVHMSFTGGGGSDTVPVIRIVRNNGSAASCSTSSQVGDTFGTYYKKDPNRVDAMATFLDSPSTTSEVFYTVCSSADSMLGVTPVSNRIDVTLVELGADLAENYYTKDDSIEAGDIVAIDSSIPAGVKKSSKKYDDQVIGVISTSPGKVLDDAIGLGFGRAVPVALSGRIPIKIITENGPIKPGDSLTSSSTPGVAMKATKPGPIIAMAMSGFDGEGIGSVLAFVRNGSFQNNEVSDLETIGLGEQEAFFSKLFSKLVSWFADAANGISDFFANRVHTKTLCLGEEKDETCITKSQLDKILLKDDQSKESTASASPL